MLSSISARLITALCGFLVVLAVSSPANASGFNYGDSLFCQFITQYAEKPKAMQTLWTYNRLYAESEEISQFDLNALMINRSQEAVYAIKRASGEHELGQAGAALLVFAENNCYELFEELREIVEKRDS